jgi:hypothetical protein
MSGTTRPGAPVLGTRAGTRHTGNERGNVDFFLDAGDGVFEIEFQHIPEVVTAARATTTWSQ